MQSSRLSALLVAGMACGIPPVLSQDLSAVPETLKPPAGESRVLTGHATGAQVYTCQAGTHGAAPAWTLKGPDASLSDDQGKLIIRHFAGPTWKHVDGSSVTGKAVAHADAPEPASVPWLLLSVTGHAGTGALTKVTSVQRLNTHGGQPPATGCDATHVGAEVRSTYQADYYFYAPATP